MMYFLYRAVTRIVTPLIPFLLRRRLARGKEDAAHIRERTGVASLSRPAGKLVWIHAASVGEANSVLRLIRHMVASGTSVLLTTVTVTSANMMRSALPDGAFHQFAPVDTPDAVKRFLGYWRPDVALWVDSEFWPNLIMDTVKSGAVMGVINARMSEKSFQSWRFARPLIQRILRCFTLCFAQSEADAMRLRALGVRNIDGVGNLKYDADPLPCDEAALASLRQAAAYRPLWLAASTHPGEEKIVAYVHSLLKGDFPGLLTVIVPRHAVRGEEIAGMICGLNVARRSQGDAITPQTDIYLADTMGELGLFYRLAPVAFIGGTLVKHGGQNPLEAARLGCAVIVGAHYHNFAAVVDGMASDSALLRIDGQAALMDALKRLLSDENGRRALGEAALRHAASHRGIMDTIMNQLRPYLC